jgi:hypothetical protein
MAPLPAWKKYHYDLLAAEISAATRYYDRVIQSGRVAGDTGYLLEAIVCPKKELAENGLPDLSAEKSERSAVLLNATFNHDLDIEARLAELRAKMSRTSRIIAVAYNSYLAAVYRLALKLGLKSGAMPSTFLTFTDLDNLCRLAGFERVRTRHASYVPFRLLGIGTFLNRILPAIPILRHFALTVIVTLRPIIEEDDEKASISIVIPARNERGNIAAAIERMPNFGRPVEVIFVEGHSSDGTWEEIQKVKAANETRLRILAFQQSGRGKADAVRLGFSHATSDLLTILDADLTMPPELLPRFVDAWARGRADFVNGSRIVYPMEGEAMRFFNRLGNVFFAKMLTWVLGVRLGDSLCGTKLVTRHDYERMKAWRRDFGDFDPFGDFELLFPAAVLALGTIDVPIRYRARTYGSTNISRFRHGLQLLKMTVIGFLRVKLARVR